MAARRRFDGAALVGGALWAGLGVATVLELISFPEPTTASLVAALGALVIVPLVASLADLPARDGSRSVWYRVASWGCLPAAVAAVVSLTLPTGTLAGLLALPWLALTGALAAYGVVRTVPTLNRPASLAVGVALWYLPVAGLALSAHRVGVSGGFGETTVLLTAVHFTFAGCALPAFVGLLARVRPPTRPGLGLLAVVLVGPGLVGLGIALSPTVEIAAAAVLAIAVAGIGAYTIAWVGNQPSASGLFVGVAAASVTVSMLAVLGYLLTRHTGLELVGFEAMLVGHGWMNAVGFALAGLVGWRLLDPPPRAPPLGLPTSRITARGRVGGDFLERRALIDEGAATGMVDSFVAFDGPSCAATKIAPEVRRFYEQTATYRLHVSPHWQPGFRVGGKLYGLVGRAIEQMNVPLETGDPSELSSQVVPVRDEADGRRNVRAWVRTYDETGAAIYVALYATHRLDDQPYMNIAFPLPWTALTSVLRVDPLGVDDPDGVELTTVDDGDGGIYLRTPAGPLRLPMDETIRVGTGSMGLDVDPEGAALVATHDMVLFGRRFLRLTYRMERVTAEQAVPETAA